MLEYYWILVRLCAHERHPYFALTGELWVSFLCYVEINDREKSGAFCIVVYIVVYYVWCYLFCGVEVWCIIDIIAGHVTPLGIQVTWHILISNGYWSLNVGSSRDNVFSVRNHDTRSVYEPMTLLAMLVLIPLVLCCAGLWSPRLNKTVSDFAVCLKLFCYYCCCQ